MNVKIVKEGGKMTAFPSGRIDSVNAPELERTLIAEIDPSVAEVVLDCTDLDYISSAGLRVVLRVKKLCPKTRLTNVKAEVYDIFEVTGFTEMMEVQKAYRVLSVEGCEAIGQGANGKVYRIDRDTIVKVYLNPDSLPEIHRERELARTAFVLGVPTAIPYDVVRIAGGGYGSVFELLNAKSFAQLWKSGEKTPDELAQMSVDLLKVIHGTLVKPDQMPSMKEVALGWAKFMKDHLPERYAQKLYALIDEVPEDLHMMHGDYHVKNVMLQNGESLLIDMDTLCHGHPVFEFASMFNAYIGYSAYDHTSVERFLGLKYEQTSAFYKKSLSLYCAGKSEKELDEIDRKARVVGFTRAIRRLIRRGGLDSAEGKAEIEFFKKELISLIDETDTLLF